MKTAITTISEFLWGFPMISLLLLSGILLTIRLGFLPIRHARHIFRATIGEIFTHKKKNQNTKNNEGITPFQAFTSALSATAGATNIVGVPIAIALGGPGALFWMWVVAFFGMSTIYTELVLGIKYREKNKDGKWIGGPRFYITNGLGWKWIGFLYAFGLMLEVIPSVMVQSNSISTTLKSDFSISLSITGIVFVFITALVIWGGIERIGKISAKLLPIFVISYVLLTSYVIVSNGKLIPETFLLIIKSAFTPIAGIGVFAGAGVIQAMRWGLARGLYTSEAGMGTSAIAYASANTDQPPKQAFWGIIAVFIDTIVICSLTGFTVIITGVWKKVKVEEAATMAAQAIATSIGDYWSSIILAVLLIFFVLATIGVIIYYGELQAEQLFGMKAKWFMRFVYLVAIYIGAVGGLKFVWELLDLLLAVIVIPNVIAIVLLSKEVKKITTAYFYDKIERRN
ncbi:sodium:alanine symporter family protein [Lottiidibacillus patelloidae]|uniref:Sodium:alanine symporter family protein n=1 Tax=Lottiidibacillus patelloidae TaxID=2670334 RepID=A0A263BR39_9BACI|nr:amino acid carrier protein [Lottiidibacillus patelloidae]OZM56159.1 sodium:alanine symporter family protein [Lottiidibacillus patelloidae]